MGTVSYLNVESKEDKITREALELVIKHNVEQQEMMKKPGIDKWFMIAHCMYTTAALATEALKGSGHSADTVHQFMQTILDDIKDPQVHEA